MRREDLMWFFVGVTLGAAATLLLAPSSGADTRRLIGAFVQDGRTLAHETAEMFEEGRRLVEWVES